jgi:hypothetical protein
MSSLLIGSMWVTVRLPFSFKCTSIALNIVPDVIAVLRKCYVKVRKTDDSLYALKSSSSIRYGLQRHFLETCKGDSVHDKSSSGVSAESRSSMVFNWPFFADKYSFVVRTGFAITCLVAFASFEDKMSSKWYGLDRKIAKRFVN